MMPTVDYTVELAKLKQSGVAPEDRIILPRVDSFILERHRYIKDV